MTFTEAYLLAACDLGAFPCAICPSCWSDGPVSTYFFDEHPTFRCPACNLDIPEVNVSLVSKERLEADGWRLWPDPDPGPVFMG